MLTFSVYGLTLPIILLLAHKEQKTNKRRYAWFIVILLSAIAGLRSFSVGKDTQSYVQIFQYLEKDMFSWAWGEVGFKYLSYALLKITGNYSFLLFFFAFFTNLFVVFRFLDYRDQASFPWMIAGYYVTFYFMSLNIMRQLFAVAILFYATREIEKKRYFRFLCWIGGATLFHTSSLLGVAFIAFDVFQWRYLNRKQKLFIVMACFAAPVSVVSVFSVVISQYGHFFTTALDNNVGLLLIAKIAVFIFGLLVLKRTGTFSNTVQNRKLPLLSIYRERCVNIYYFIGIVLAGFGYFFSFMDRIGLPFYMFECVYCGMMVRNKKVRQLFKFIFFVLLTYMFITDLISNGQGHLPYTFVWQKI